MSYILDALKKSDQKRKQGDVPDLQSIHVPLTVEAQVSRWPYVIIIFLLMGLVFLLGWMRPWQTVVIERPVSQGHQLLLQEEKEPVLVEQPVPEMVAADQADMSESNRQPEQPVRSVVQPAVVETKEIEQLSVPHLEELPELIQQAIPDMSFAGHVYSSNPVQRSVIINGSAMGEGDLVIDGLKIEQITRKGVIFDYQAQLFRIDILQDWSFD